MPLMLPVPCSPLMLVEDATFQITNGGIDDVA
jgi:hypothetical protein